MNKFITSVTKLDLPAVKEFVKEPRWRAWTEPDGKNALHYLCAVNVRNKDESETSLKILKLLLNIDMDINSVHWIEDKNCERFPATPLWYGYTRGRNERLYKYLLKHGADPRNCWWAIAWYDDVAAAKLWLKHGAVIDKKPSLDDLFLGSFQWKKYTFAFWVLEQGADVNARGRGGLTALMLAVKRKEEDLIKLLLRCGADPNLEDDKGMSARKIAKAKAPQRILRLL